MKTTEIIRGSFFVALIMLQNNSNAQRVAGSENIGEDSTSLGSVAEQYQKMIPKASTSHAQEHTINIRTSAGQYVLRRYKSNGALVPANQVQCQPNPVTGSCSCPAGTNDYPYMVGQSYLYKDWDTYFELHLCYTN